MLISTYLLGFRISIRLVVAIDGKFLKKKYLRTLCIASCKNGNNQIYPLAFRIGDLENDALWEWFLKNPHDAIRHIDYSFMILDQHNSIEKSIFVCEARCLHLSHWIKFEDKVQESYNS